MWCHKVPSERLAPLKIRHWRFKTVQFGRKPGIAATGVGSEETFSRFFPQGAIKRTAEGDHQLTARG